MLTSKLGFVVTLKRILVCSSAICLFLGLGGGIWQVGEWQVEKTWKSHVAAEVAELKTGASSASDKFTVIYSGIRTIALLPSVRNVDRDAHNLSEDSRANIQQIYNNLKSQLDVSEIYILPADFNPQRIDPKTGKLQAPIASFDELIVHGGKYAALPNPFAAQKDTENTNGQPEEEGEEYAVMVEQLDLFSRWDSRELGAQGLKVPMLTSKEVITCDNTIFNKTLVDADRQGIILSVPFYGDDQSFRGMISAIVRTDVVVGFAKGEGLSIIAPRGSVGKPSVLSNGIDHDLFQPDLWRSHPQQLLHAHADIKIPDIGGKWMLRIVRPANQFYQTAEFREIRNFTLWMLVLLAVAACLTLAVVLASSRRSAKLKHAATHDALTGLPNRVLVENYIKQAMAGRTQDTKNIQALFYLDLDKFKLVNDTMGHQVGDEVLKHAAEVLRNCVRKDDVVARIGGDEFVILVSGMKSVDQIIALAKRITTEMRVPIKLGRQTAYIGTSVGIAMLDNNANSPGELLRHADLALFRAKAQERGNFRFYAPEMDAERDSRRGLEADLHNALKNNEFVLHYQPIHNAATSEITGYEALVRWLHPTRGMIPPLQFIELAEESGFINELGEWILLQACTDALKFDDHLRMAVNLSPVQCRNPTLPLKILSILNQVGLAPRRLELEITEGVLLADDKSTIDMLNQLRAIGVRIALDDFGTGYSSLGYLKSFEFDKVKIDRSFLQNIEQDKEAVVLKAVTQLSNSLGMATVAEGVETVEQLLLVKEQGCTEVQGYYFSKPKPIEELVQAQQKKISAASQE